LRRSHARSSDADSNARAQNPKSRITSRSDSRADTSSSTTATSAELEPDALEVLHDVQALHVVESGIVHRSHIASPFITLVESGLN